MASTPAVRRKAFWIGVAGLGLATLIGASAGWSGALMLALLYVALCAGWGVLTTRTWWGRTSRGRAAAVGGGALVAVLVVATVGGTTTDPEVGMTAEPASTSAPAEPSSAAPSPSPSPSSKPSATPTPKPSPTPTKKPKKQPSASPTPKQKAGAGTALAAVATLDVKGRAPKTGYDRDEFGSAWSDVDHNGCDTRNDVLRRDLDDIATRAGTHGCVVLTGTFHDPYSGTTMAFQRGVSTSTLVQIDHLVALSDAWQKGAQRLSDEERRLLANDPLNLLASDGSLNMSKGDGDTATWLPPNKKFRCTYVARQVAVKHSYDLWVTSAERDAMVRVLSTCPDKKLPTGDVTVAAAPLMPGTATTKEPSEPTTSSDGGGSGDTSGGDVYYQNCDAARAAGAAPVHSGDPGYSRSLDRDGDGVGCE